MQLQVNQMFNLGDYQILPIKYVSLNISFLQHEISVRHLGYGRYKTLNMEINTYVRTITISLKT